MTVPNATINVMALPSMEMTTDMSFSKILSAYLYVFFMTLDNYSIIIQGNIFSKYSS
jgi:hypothetical protein